MPSISTSVDVDFDWDEVIHSHSSVERLADAIEAAGLSGAMIKALQEEMAESAADPRGADDERPDPLTALDRLVDDYARGLPIDEQLRRIAYTHCGRVIAAVH
jgi:hypothetical protein